MYTSHTCVCIVAVVKLYYLSKCNYDKMLIVHINELTMCIV